MAKTFVEVIGIATSLIPCSASKLAKSTLKSFGSLEKQ